MLHSKDSLGRVIKKQILCVHSHEKHPHLLLRVGVSETEGRNDVKWERSWDERMNWKDPRVFREKEMSRKERQIWALVPKR